MQAQIDADGGSCDGHTRALGGPLRPGVAAHPVRRLRPGRGDRPGPGAEGPGQRPGGSGRRPDRGFGSGQGGFGLSSCAIDSSAGVLSPKGPVGLAAPHAFSSSGPRSMAAAVTSGGCAPGAGSTLQRLTAEVVLPPLPVLGRSSAVVMASLRCPGASNRVRSTKRGRKRARRSLLCLLNYERTRRGLRPVRSDRRLTRAAFGHSRRMVRLRFFAHVGPGSLSLSGRLRRARYLPARGGRWFVGENIAFGRGRSGSPLGVHRAWMHSTPHRLDMLHPRFRQVGFGIYRGAPYGRRGVTYTADFGRKGR